MNKYPTKRPLSCLRLIIYLVLSVIFIFIIVFIMGVYDIIQSTNTESIKSTSHEINLEKIYSTMISIPEGLHINKENVKDTANEAQIIGTKRLKIAYAVTITKDSTFIDGALVLGYAAKKYHDVAKGYPSIYDVDLVAFAAHNVKTSIPILEKYGWRVLQRPLPVLLEEIENKDYVNNMRNSGCCGADEFLKLWAYTLTEYHRVIHLDMDSIIFKNMDELYSIDKELLYTGDYNMKGGSKVVPVQGGFLVVKPSIETFEEFRNVIRKGDYGPKGWEGSHIGKFWGGQTIQGIMPFFYHVKHPDRGYELNRCIYNCMVDNPYWPNTLKCQDGQVTCQDCRLQKPELVSSAHFTICQKPWTCTEHVNPKNKDLCQVLHAKWFQLRDELEQDLHISSNYRMPNTRYKDSLGMCKGYGDKKYLQIPLPLI